MIVTNSLTRNDNGLLVVVYRKIGWGLYSTGLKGCVSLFLPRLPKLPGPFEKHWLGNIHSLGSNKDMQPFKTPTFCGFHGYASHIL